MCSGPAVGSPLAAPSRRVPHRAFTPGPHFVPLRATWRASYTAAGLRQARSCKGASPGAVDGSPRQVVGGPSAPVGRRPEVRGPWSTWGRLDQDEGGGTRSVEPTRMVFGSASPGFSRRSFLTVVSKRASDGAERVTALDDVEVAGGRRWAWLEAAPGRRQVARSRRGSGEPWPRGASVAARLGRTGDRRRCRPSSTGMPRPRARRGAGRRAGPAAAASSPAIPTAGDGDGGRGDEQDRRRCRWRSEPRVRAVRGPVPVPLGPGLPADVPGAGRVGGDLTEQLPLPIADRDRGQARPRIGDRGRGRGGRQVGPGAGAQEWADERVGRAAGQRQQRLRRRTVKVGRSVERPPVGIRRASARRPSRGVGLARGWLVDHPRLRPRLVGRPGV